MGLRVFRSSPARSIPTSATWPARASCWPRRTRCFPQFATHNAQTLAAHSAWRAPISASGNTNSNACTAWASRSTRRSWAPTSLDRPCRDLCAGRLARDVARLSGAAAAGERRQLVVCQPHADPIVPIDELVADPVAVARAIGRPGRAASTDRAAARLFGAERANSRGIDLADEQRLAALARAAMSGTSPWRAAPMLAAREAWGGARGSQPGRSPRPRRRCAPRRAEQVAKRWPLASAPLPPGSRRRRSIAPPAVSRRRCAGGSGWRARRPDRARGRQIARQRHRRSAGGGGFLALLCAAGDAHP